MTAGAVTLAVAVTALGFADDVTTFLAAGAAVFLASTCFFATFFSEVTVLEGVDEVVNAFCTNEAKASSLDCACKARFTGRLTPEKKLSDKPMNKHRTANVV
jgi:hypothetical protein